MNEFRFSHILHQQRWQSVAIVAVLLLVAVLGYHPAPLVIVVPFALAGGLFLLRNPVWGPFLLVATALFIPLGIPTGTEVDLNLSALIIPLLLLIWVLTGLVKGTISIGTSRVNRPLLLFLIVGLLSIVIGNVTWDPTVPKPDRFIVVQLAQWAIYAFSAGMFWLIGYQFNSVTWLRRLTWWCLVLAGLQAMTRALPGGTDILASVATLAWFRAPFWTLLTAMAVGQLLFNQGLSHRWRFFLILCLVAVALFSFIFQQERLSTWSGVVAAAGVLLWIRLPRWRWAVMSVVVVLVASGLLFQIIYDLAGGDAKWQESGGSREVLIGRVISVSMRNPITGIGPAAYRMYGFMEPLYYEGAYYINPKINSHNNYVDLFSSTGVLGLGLFLWFMLEVILLGNRLRSVYRDGFEGAYVRSAIAIAVGSLVIMLLADWILPFVYNIGFVGFQASILVWTFMGGLVLLERKASPLQTVSRPR